MDKPLARPRNRGWRKYRSHIVLGLVVVLVVFLVAAIVPIWLYFMTRGQGVPARAETVRMPERPTFPPTPIVLFADAWIVDVNAGQLRGPQDVLVRDGLIVEISDDIRTPRGAVEVAASGKYLMPGLIDTHVHLTTDEQLLLFLASGVTTVQSLGGPLAANVARRTAVEGGTLAGPEIVSCDAVAQGPVGDVDAFVGGAQASGVECVKIYSPPDWTARELSALVTLADRKRMRVGGHLARNLPLTDGLGHGQQFVAHAEEFLYAHFFKFDKRLDEARIPEVIDLARRAGVSVTATLVAYHAIVEQVGPGLDGLVQRPELKYVPADVLDNWMPPNNRYRRRFTPEDGTRLRRSYEFQKTFLAAFAAAGIPIALGTDASPAMPFVVPGFSALDELDELAAAGLPPAAVLAAATANGARQLRRTDIGNLRAGGRADALLLEANPLDDVRNVRKTAGVLAHGRWIARSALDTALAGIERSTR